MRTELTKQQIDQYEEMLKKAVSPLATSETLTSFQISVNGGKIHIARFFVSWRAESYHCDVSFWFKKGIEDKIFHNFPYIPHSGLPYAFANRISISGMVAQEVVNQILSTVEKLISISKQ